MNASFEQNICSYFKHTKNPFSDNLSDIRKELRQRRKSFLGSYISVNSFFRQNETNKEDMVHSLSLFLAKRTLALWDGSPSDAENFSYRFYMLAIKCLMYDELAYESVDDIIQLAECLVRSRKIFVIATKKMLPSDMIGELFDFTESYYDNYYTSNFEDAVLGAISVLLGALTDPINDSTDKEVKL